jgi:hypothetical protein
MPTLYALSDAVVSYPDFDSFAATLVEAAACQLPVITPLLPTYRGTFVEPSLHPGGARQRCPRWPKP